MPTGTVVAFYVSGHGFGHAARAAELIRALLIRRPDLRVVVRTSAPRWLFERVARQGVTVQACQTDPALAEVDGLRLDEPETARRAAAFYRDFERRAAIEAVHLRPLAPAIVVADVPPLAFAAARLAGTPSVAVANFTWDWIYAHDPHFERRAPGVLETVARAYAGATAALRLPISGGFAAMPSVVEDVPFIVRRSLRDADDTRRRLNVSGDHRLALWSFGGAGLLPPEGFTGGRLTVVAPRQTLPDGLNHEDLVAAADFVVSKPGYGIVSECIAHRKPLLYVKRERFAEYDRMVEDMPRTLRCRLVSRDDLATGRWRESMEALLAEREPSLRPRVDGADVAAEKILSLSDR